MPDETSTREGELLAQKYRLGKRLGAGGQGEVYRAHNELIGREVAIKLLRAEWAKDATTVTRFVREARAANMVRHPNVVDVLDIGTEPDGTPFIVQELLSGLTLDDHLDARGGRLLPPEALDLCLPVCDGVGAAHQRGVVHRDLKPGNVFLVPNDNNGFTPKVLDFGLSKIAESTELDVTATGSWFGTPAYMAPEQIRRTRSVDARSDVWSLGVMLYELLAGRRPFDSTTVGDLFVVICTEDPAPLREFAPHVSSAIAQVVHRCLAREPEDRFATAKELADGLRAARSGSGVLPVTTEHTPARAARRDQLAEAETVGPQRTPIPAPASLDGLENPTRRVAPMRVVSPSDEVVAAIDHEVRGVSQSNRNARRMWIGAVSVVTLLVLGAVARFALHAGDAHSVASEPVADAPHHDSPAPAPTPAPTAPPVVQHAAMVPTLPTTALHDLQPSHDPVPTPVPTNTPSASPHSSAHHHASHANATTAVPTTTPPAHVAPHATTTTSTATTTTSPQGAQSDHVMRGATSYE